MAEPTLLDRMRDRLQKEQAHREEVAQRHASELEQIDKRLAALQSVVDNWNSLTSDQTFAALKMAGFNLRVDIE